MNASDSKVAKTARISGHDQPIAQLPRFSNVASHYDAVFCDIWGVLHDGMTPFPEAATALSQFRAQTGGAVILVSNAQRPNTFVREHLLQMGVSDAAFDAIVTSGDVTRHRLRTEFTGVSVYHLGPDRNEPFFDDLPVERVAADAAELVVCTGLFDETRETPEDYRDLLSQFVTRDVALICANPDKIVDRGDFQVYCAGAISDLFEALGGRTFVYGKPHAPIYEAAMEQMGGNGAREIDRTRILAIGDSLRTDITGAATMGFDALFMTEGIHAHELGPANAPDPDKVSALLSEHRKTVIGFQCRLTW